MLRMIKYRIWRAFLDNFPGFHEDNRIGNFVCKAHFMRDHHHRYARLRKLLDNIEHLAN